MHGDQDGQNPRVMGVEFAVDTDWKDEPSWARGYHAARRFNISMSESEARRAVSSHATYPIPSSHSYIDLLNQTAGYVTQGMVEVVGGHTHVARGEVRGASGGGWYPYFANTYGIDVPIPNFSVEQEVPDDLIGVRPSSYLISISVYNHQYSAPIALARTF